MSADSLINCGCCKADAPASTATYDDELSEVVCDECRRHLRNAKAWLAAPFDNHGRPINIKGCYKGGDAPDNQ